MFDNDHTDAEAARRELAYEMGEETPDERRYGLWVERAESLLIDAGVTTEQRGLDGDQETEGFSLDLAYELFLEGNSPEDFVTGVFFERGLLGFRDGDAA
jgi:hypothetical protein